MDPETFRALEKLVDYVATGSQEPFPVQIESALIQVWCWMEEVQPSMPDTERPAPRVRKRKKRR